MIVKLLVEGGNMSPGPALAQKLGPLGINMGQVIAKVNEATKEFKGTKVPVDLDVDVATKGFTINVKSPPVSELLKKEAGVEKGSGAHKKIQVGNLAIEQIIKIAKTKLPEMLERDLKSAVKTIVGSCVSLGILIENKPAVEVASEIQQGKYDKEIQQEKTHPSEEKIQQIKEFFNELIKKQEAIAVKGEVPDEKGKGKKAPAPPAKKEDATKSKKK
jgi:large subunit ribosomal protein L11